MILFKPGHKDLILADIKTQTRRTGEKRWNIGAVHQARTNMPWQGEEGYFCDLKILDVRREKLNRITLEDVRAEGYSSYEEFEEVWEEIHGEWDTDLQVWVVEFEVFLS